MAYPPPAADGDRFSPPPDPPWHATLLRWGRSTLAGLVSVVVSYLGGCTLALGIYAAVFPPVTGVQLQRDVEGLFSKDAPERTYVPIPLSQIDPDLPLAVVAGEDSRFFLHGGFDWTEVANALQTYRQGGNLRGASTISQQLVKNLFLTTHSTLLRKALEVPLTYAAELLLSKRRILELYVNVIEWGPGVYGAEAATHYYYGTSAQRLTRGQAAALAACIPAPLQRHPKTVGAYQQVILQRMTKIGRLPISALLPSPSHFRAILPAGSLPDTDPRLLSLPSPTDYPL